MDRPYLARRLASHVTALLSVAVLGAGCSMRGLIYPAPGVQVGAPPRGFEEVVVRPGDGSEVVAWHRPLSGSPDRPAMLFFHGNGENLETMKGSGQFDQLASLDLPLLVVDYPGYGRSSGQPSEESLKRAATAALQWMSQRYPGRAVVPCGWSLGAALAVHLAAVMPTEIDGLVAISAWTSMHEVANAHFPQWLVSVGLRERYDSLGAARQIDSPALIIHGTLDRIIPMDQGQRLAASLPAARWVPVEGAGHNDLLAFSEVWQEIDRFVSGLRVTGSL